MGRLLGETGEDRVDKGTKWVQEISLGYLLAQ